MTKRLAFERLRASKRARVYLARSPPEVRRCLVEALEAIQQKRLRMQAHPNEPNLFTTAACEHEILVSTTPDGSTVVILEIGLQDEDPL